MTVSLAVIAMEIPAQGFAFLAAVASKSDQRKLLDCLLMRQILKTDCNE